MLARAYMAAGAGAQAVQEARNAVTLAPGEWSAHLVLGLALEATGASAEGAAEVSRALALKPKEKMSAADHAMFASALQRAGKPDQALVEYRSAALLDPSNASYRRLAGDVLIAMKRNGEALVEYQKAARIDPTDSLVQADLASALYATGKKADAIDVLQKAVEKDPNNPAIRRVLGEYLLADNDVEGALFQLDVAATLPGVEPSLLASILIDRGNARDRKEDFAGAIADYARAISTDPSRGDAWFYLAGDLERTNKPVDARAAYTNAATLCKARPEWQKFADEANAKLAQAK
jgi:Flp pilus assembly protein TadD